jgi:hypothetical protein
MSSNLKLQLWPFLPYDILSSIFSILSLKDRLALSSISHATRATALDSCFSSLIISEKNDFKAQNALENSAPSFRNAIKCVLYLLLDNITIPTCRKIEIHTTYGNRPWRSSWFKILPMIPGLYSVTCSIVYISQLGSFFDAVKHAPLRTLSITIMVDKIAPAVAGLSGLESLRVRWTHDYYSKEDTPKLDVTLSNFSWGLIQPSINTLHDLDLAFVVYKNPEDTEPEFDMELLKSAKLHTFSYEDANGTNTDIIAQLPRIMPRVTKLSLLWVSWNRQPVFNVSRYQGDKSDDVDVLSQESYIAFFAQLPSLAHLTLSLDLEKEANDPLKRSFDKARYNRSLHRRLHASELLAEQCHALEWIDWVEIKIDNDGNYCRHRFVVEETPSSGRVVKTIADWWMVPQYKNEHGGPLPLDLVVNRKDSHFEQWMPSSYPRICGAHWQYVG